MPDETPMSQDQPDARRALGALTEARKARARLLRAQRAYETAVLAAIEAGHSRGEIAKTLGISKGAVSRFLSRRS